MRAELARWRGVTARIAREVVAAGVEDVARRLQWDTLVEGASVSVRTDAGWQLWRADAGWIPGTTCAVAVRAESWVLQVPSVRVEIVEGLALVLEGCRRFSVEKCADEWHPLANTACPGHPRLAAPDPFPFERFVRSVLSGRVVCGYLDGLLDPEDAPERRWGGFVWLPREDAEQLEAWQGSIAHPMLVGVETPVSEHDPATLRSL